MNTKLLIRAAYLAAFLLPLIWDALVNCGHPF